MKTGELLAKEGFISQDDIHKALLLQEKEQATSPLNKKRLFGMILCDLNLITPWDNYYVLHKYNRLQSIQSALVSKKILTREVVERSEKDAQQQNIPLISSLIDSGLVSTNEMHILLSDLFHIPFKSINNFIYDKKDIAVLIQTLDKQKSWENKSMPLVLKNNTILFGITDPENILFIRNLNDLFPQYRFKTVFISFSWFSKLHNELYESDRTTAPAKVPAPPARKKPLDLSLLLNFKTSIKDPEQDNDAIQTLYERYELIRQLIGNSKRVDLQNEFKEFVIQTHRNITQKYHNQIIEFSFKKENRDVKIIAFPKT
ncbi:MAG: hypothetical protein H8D87_18210 [Deltaproteobacteria bacterium]|uniref:hypothetical protein n=1 Tax=Desulfobacula sp. TaxID=2593537 RepID=UPI0019C52158|nr:hypothetical protein [Candidatus Desulfobacula maris]MBL6993080.1 hypothetical protein [Desulfobacula sp.]